jgi:hypothetical protein
MREGAYNKKITCIIVEKNLIKMHENNKKVYEALPPAI